MYKSLRSERQSLAGLTGEQQERESAMKKYASPYPGFSAADPMGGANAGVPRDRFLFGAWA